MEWCIFLFYLPLSDKLNFVYRDQIGFFIICYHVDNIYSLSEIALNLQAF